MPAPIAVQLYTLRDALAADYEGIIGLVAEAGYLGVETAGMYGKGPKQAKSVFDELGLQVTSGHGPLPLGDKQNEVLDTISILGCKYWVLAFLPPEQFRTRDQIQANCEQLNRASAIAHKNGVKLLYHNHWWEFTPAPELDGQTPFEAMVGYLDDSVGFELDVYWAQTGGSNPVDVVRQYGNRAPLLHIKDGPATKDAPMVAVGSGVLDMPAIIEAGEATSEWLIVELDRCATDMLDAVRKSYTYLTGNGLARGRD